MTKFQLLASTLLLSVLNFTCPCMLFGFIKTQLATIETDACFSHYTVSQKKTCHYTFVCNFAKCWPIFKIPSLTDSVVNFAIKSLWNIPPHHRCVTTLPCEICLFRNCLFLLKTCHQGAWDNQSFGTLDTCVYLARFVASEQPRPKPSWLQKLGRNAATCLLDKSPECERLEAMSN